MPLVVHDYARGTMASDAQIKSYLRSRSHLGAFWDDHGAEVIVGVITAVLSAIATYYAMKAVSKMDRKK